MSEEKSEKQRVLTGKTDDGQTFVVSGQGLARAEAPDAEKDESETHPTDQIEEPAKVMRIGTMVRTLLEEVKAAPLDEASRARLSTIYDRSVAELAEGLSPELAEELQRITEPFAEGATPSDAELRIAQAQLVGWLEGLFQGIQTALFAQQMAARSQLEQMRKALTDGSGPQMPGPSGSGGGGSAGGGMYL